MPAPLTAARRREIRTAIAAGRRPTRGASNRTVLATGAGQRGRNKYVVLADPAGTLTPAGELYYDETGIARPEAAFDRQQQLISRNGNDYIRTRTGREALVRSLKADGSTTVTKLGETFFKDKFVEYVVHVPSKIRLRRANGTEYIRQEWLPVHKLGINAIMENARFTPEQAHARVRSRVLSELGLRTQGGETVLLEVSSETWTYDRERDDEWQISSMATQVDAEGRVDVQTALRQPMAALPEAPRSCAAQLPFPEQILPCAFEVHGDKLCVCRQLAALLQRPLAHLVDTFTALKWGDEWKQHGLTAEDLKEFCVSEGHPYFFLSSGRLLLTYEPPEKRGRAIACALFDGHCFMYKSARCLANWNTSDVVAHDRSKLQQETKSRLPPLSEWKAWDEQPRDGTFWCRDLAAVRSWFLCSGRSPRVSLRNMVEIGALSYLCTSPVDGCTGECRIRQLPQEAAAIQRWLAALPVQLEYRGEGLPSITERVFNTLLKSERRSPSPTERQRILAEQDSRCYLCGGIFDGLSDVEFDHVTPLRQTVRGQRQVFAAACASCHLEKTQLESRQDRTLQSHVAPHVWREYVQSPRPPALVFEAHKGDEKGTLMELDVRRCRANALARSVHAWPVFCPYDSIVQSTAGVLADLSFIELPPKRKQSSLLGRLPYLGPAWYSRPVVEWLLHTNQCDWGDIKLSLQASSHVPPTCLRAVLDTMARAWPEEESQLQKLSVNAMCGLWAAQPEHAYHVKTSQHAEDCPGFHLKRVVSFGDGQSTTDWIYATRLVGNATMRPIHDFIMGIEYTRVAMLKFAVECSGVPSRAIRQIKTDCLLLQPAQKHIAKLIAITSLTHKDLPDIVQRCARLDPGQTRLTNRMPLTKGGDNTPVFRYTLGAGATWLQGYHHEPRLDVPLPALVQDWHDLDEPAAVEAAKGEGLLCCGMPGVGKSHWARRLVAALREEGKVVHCIAKTHLACKNFQMNAQTADHWCIRVMQNGDCQGVQHILVEECSQLNVQLWSYMCQAKMRGCKFICLGDFGQFQPVAESWAGSPVPADALQRSAMLRELCGGNRFTLTENKRSDPPLFDFISTLRPGTPEAKPLLQALAEARQLFPVTDRPAQWLLVMSHRKRMQHNRLMNQARKPRDAVFFRFRPPHGNLSGNQPQSMYVWRGMTLVGASGACPKGILVEVEDVTAVRVVLSNGAELLAEQVCKCTRLAHCLCYASVQGLTLPGVVRLSDTASPMLTLRHLYVGISRATAAASVEVN